MKNQIDQSSEYFYEEEYYSEEKENELVNQIFGEQQDIDLNSWNKITPIKASVN